MLPVTGYEDSYLITLEGKIISNKTNKPLATSLSNAGYLQVALWKNNKGSTKHVHRLIAEHFLPRLDGKDFVNHKDGNKLNNHVDNLEWVTKSENAIHALETGLVVKPRRLSEQETLVVLRRVLEGETLTSIEPELPIKLSRLSVQLRIVAKKYGLLEAYKDAVTKAHSQRLLKRNQRTSTTRA